MSKRDRAVRRMRYESALLRTGRDGTGNFAASLASSPKLALLFDAACTTRESFATHSDALTPNRFAAAVISISRAAAPATHIPNTPVPRIAVDPPVACVPNHRATRYVP